MSTNRILSVGVLTVLILCTASSRVSADSCPSGQPCERYSIQSFFKATWPKAVQACGYQGKRLASITSAADQAALEYQIVQNKLEGNQFWVSGNSLFAPKFEFSWANGRPLTYANWGGGEPSNSGGKEFCINVRGDRKWNDEPCNLKYYFVCENID